MYKILKKEVLNPTVTRMDIDAPMVARKAQPGQFIILRTDKDGERIPLTIADYDRENGTVTIIFQVVGATTEKLNHMNEGDYLRDFVGPLGRATHTEGLKRLPLSAAALAALSRFPLPRSFTPRAVKFIRSSASAIKILSFWKKNSMRTAAASVR